MINSVQVSPAEYAAGVNPYWMDAVTAMGMDVTVVAAHGCWLEDDQGQRLLDFVGGFGTAAIGHNHPRLTQALERALRDGAPDMLPLGVVTEAGQLAARLLHLTQTNGALAKVYFASTGAEAIDAALKFATARTGRTQFLSFDGDFHGLSIGATPLAGGGEWSVPFSVPGASVTHVPFEDLNAAEAALADERMAAVVLEVVQGSTGAQTWRADRLRDLSQLCRQHGTLLILDEVLTGLGRTGRWFAFQHAQDVVPDLVVVSKGLTGARFPVSAVLMSEAIFDASFGRPGHARIQSATFSEHRLGMICGLTCLEIIDTEGLVERARCSGQRLLNELHDLVAEGRLAEARGRGLLLAFRVGERPDLDAQSATLRCWQRLAERGVLTMPAAHEPEFLRLTPALVVGDEEVDYFVCALREALDELV